MKPENKLPVLDLISAEMKTVVNTLQPDLPPWPATGTIAEQRQYYTSMRTKEALARRKQEGIPLGRRKGDNPKLQLLYENKRYILKQARSGAKHAKLAREFGVSRTTMFRFLKAEGMTATA